MAYGNLLTDVVQSSTTGTAPVFKDGNGTETGQLCKAWVNFDGSLSTPGIRAAFNVTSITKNGTGDFTVNFTNAFPDNYYTIGHALAYDLGGSTPTNYTALSIKQGAYSTFNATTSCRVYACYTASGSGGPQNMEVVRLNFFR